MAWFRQGQLIPAFIFTCLQIDVKYRTSWGSQSVAVRTAAAWKTPAGAGLREQQR